MKKSFFLALALPVLIISCNTNAVTGRKQLSLLPESQLQQQAVTEYRTFLSQSKVVNENVLLALSGQNGLVTDGNDALKTVSFIEKCYQHIHF